MKISNGVKKTEKLILWLKEISKEDVPLVGGKNASLGEMFSKLSQKAYPRRRRGGLYRVGLSSHRPSRALLGNRGVNIPDGFTLTSDAFWYYLKFNGIDEKLKEIFEKFNSKSIESLKETGKKSRQLILKGKFPPDLEKEIIENYEKLSKGYEQKNVDVAVRSSATAEDLATASFAGEHETYLNISGPKNLLPAIKKCIASLFTDRAIAYREEKGFEHLKIALSAGIQKMVRSDLASSGVIFTLDTETGFPNVVLINSIFGIGEMIVKGKITPDEFYVFKPTLKEGFKSIIVKNLGRKTKKYIYAKGGGLKEVAVPQKDQLKFSLTDE